MSPLKYYTFSFSLMKKEKENKKQELSQNFGMTLVCLNKMNQK